MVRLRGRGTVLLRDCTWKCVNDYVCDIEDKEEMSEDNMFFCSKDRKKWDREQKFLGGPKVVYRKF